MKHDTIASQVASKIEGHLEHARFCLDSLPELTRDVADPAEYLRISAELVDGLSEILKVHAKTWRALADGCTEGFPWTE